MKKVSGFILVFLFTLLLAGQGFAQTEAKVSKDEAKVAKTTSSEIGKFVDSDGDGKCDHSEIRGISKSINCQFVDANKDGTCDHFTEGKCSKGNLNCCKGQGTNCLKGTGAKNHPGCIGPCGNKNGPDKK